MPTPSPPLLPRADDEGPFADGPFHGGPRRWAGALVRRLAAPWVARRLARRAQLVERALGWLASHAAADEGERDDRLAGPTWADEAAALAAWADHVGREPAASGDAETDPGSTIALAREALAAFDRGDRVRGDRLAERLFARQRADGSFPRRLGRFGRAFDGPASPRATALVVRVAEAQVAAGFTTASDDLPALIDEADGRWQAVWQLARELAPGATVLEAGCGSGRFLHRLAASRPDLSLVGIDPSADALARAVRGGHDFSLARCSLPAAGVASCEEPCAADPQAARTLRQGSLKRLPWPSAGCDLALAIESLEHSLWPARAIAELARVVRPGGQVLVIDKCRQRQPLSQHEPWEVWFSESELRAWLTPWCERVSFTPISHGRQGQGGLFFACWGLRSARPMVRRRALEPEPRLG